MPISPKRFFKITGIIVLVLGTIIIVASFIVSAKLEGKIFEKIEAAGFRAKSVSISLLNQSVALDSVVYLQPDSLQKNPHKLFIQKIKVNGIHVYSFLKKKELIIDHIVIHQGSIEYNKNFRIKKNSGKNSPDSTNKIKSIRIKHFSVSELQTAVLNDTITESSADINNFELSELKLAFKQDTTYSVGAVKAELSNLLQSKKGSLHNFSVAKIIYNSNEEHLEADSFKINSDYNKADFARIAKIQKTRLDIILPKIVFEGIKQERFISDSTLEVTRITIPKPTVHAYRDKRYPFVRDWIMPLPIEGIRRLPFKLKIDSILIQQADIAYEEFSEKGLPTTGTITFNKLSASFAGLSTELKQPPKNSFCTLVADCKVMNSGSLHATFRMPLNSTVNYQAYGNVINMDLKSLNPSLGNLTRIEISDGTLNDLRFNFSYNDDISTGEVLINYKGLKLEALKKEKKSHETNKLLTAAINAIIKSDKDKSVDKSKRTGLIDIERDKKRFVFQFWWKSLLDGLQSTFINNGKKKKTLKKKESSK